MTSSIRSKLSYANVMASVAVFAALGGGAFAATQKAAKDSVVSSSIKNGKVKSIDLKDGGVGGADLADGSVASSKLADGSVAGPKLADGSVTGTKIAGDSVRGIHVEDGSLGSADLEDGGVTGTDLLDGTVAGADVAADSLTGADIDEASLGKVGEADTLDGVDSAEVQRYDASIPSGTIVRGVWGGRESPNGSGYMASVINLPASTPAELNDTDVNVAASGTSGAAGADDDATCNPLDPPAGKVCIKVNEYLGDPDTIEGLSMPTALGDRYGFRIRGPYSDSGDLEAYGTWAYRAP